MSFDLVSYLMGKKNGTGDVVIEGGVTCTDPNNDGNVVIEEN